MAAINAVYARILARRLQDEGVDGAELLEGTHLSMARLWQMPELDLAQFLVFLRNARRLSRAPSIGFLIGDHHSTIALGQMGVAMGAAPNLRAGLQAVESFTSLQVTYLNIHLKPSLDGLSLIIDVDAVEPEFLPLHAESTMMLFKRYVERLSTRPLRDARYAFPYNAPDYAELYRSYLGEQVSFDAPQAAMHIPSSWLDLPSPYHDRELWNQSMQTLAARLRAAGDVDRRAYSRHIQRYLRARTLPLPGLAEVAGELHVSQRTLTRRLAEEGTTFRELRVRLLDEWACQYLRDTQDTVDSIALTLGYRDAANFRRAFRKRHGASPLTYRQAYSEGSPA